MRDNGMMEAFRVDDLLFSVIPEIFSRESTSSVMPEILNQASMFLSISGPRLKDCRGDEGVEIHCLCFFFLEP